MASLRVYEPIEVFPEAERLRWANISVKLDTIQQEQLSSLKRSITLELPFFKQDGVHLLEIEGKRFCSPWSTLNRCFNALYDFKAALPGQLFKYFVSVNFEQAFEQSSDLVQDKVSYIKTETWNIPPRWFGLFKPEDKFYGHNEEGAFMLIRTNIQSAKKRCKFMHKIVLGTFGVGPIEQEIRDLLEWLSIFHEESIVELDYGGLAVFMEKVLVEQGESGLDSDSSIEDLQKSLSGLASADGNKAGHGYERLISRWRKVAAFEQAV